VEGKFEKMNKNNADIIFWNHKAFMPSNIFHNSGMYSCTEPIYILNPSISDLLPAVQTILTTNPLILPDPTREEAQKQWNLLPKKTGAGSWKRLYKEGFCYMIALSDEGYLLMKSTLDLKERWIFKAEDNIIFPPNTDLVLIIQEILGDLEKRQRDERLH
jgi:hypothetical protein